MNNYIVKKAIFSLTLFLICLIQPSVFSATNNVDQISYTVFYNIDGKDIANLTSWASAADGKHPSSFGSHNTLWTISNSALLSGEISITGRNSKMLISGTDTRVVTLTLMPGSKLNALVDVEESGQLNILSSNYPKFGVMQTGSTVIFSLDDKIIPYHDFFNLTILGSNPKFVEAEDKTVKVRGALTLTGKVTFPQARNGVRYNFHFYGPWSQHITTNGNVLRAFNISFEKPDGAIRLLPETIISADNNISFNIKGDAVLDDNGATFYAGNSISLSGMASNYNFSGTFILAGTEDGIVNSAAAGNTYSIDLEESSNIVFHNIHIKANNKGGVFSLGGKATNPFEMNGNLIIDSKADGIVKFNNKQAIIRGEFKTEEGFKGKVEEFTRLGF
jgi:hypothetical protein